MFNKKEYIVSCGTFDWTVMQHRQDYHFIVVNKRTQRATKTNDCILKVSKNPEKYIWEEIK